MTGGGREGEDGRPAGGRGDGRTRGGKRIGAASGSGSGVEMDADDVLASLETGASSGDVASVLQLSAGDQCWLVDLKAPWGPGGLSDAIG